MGDLALYSIWVLLHNENQGDIKYEFLMRR